MVFQSSFFDDFEKEILGAAYLVLKDREAVLNALTSFQLTEKGLGIEGWFTVELLVNETFRKWGTTKIQKCADLLIKDKYLEIKGLSDTNFTWITDWWDKRKKTPSIVLFLSVFNENMKNQIKEGQSLGRQIEYRQVNEGWIVGIFDGMNKLWRELWQHKSEELQRLDIIQINKILEVTENNIDGYEEWVKKVTKEDREKLLKGLKIEDHELFETMLKAYFVLA